MATYTCAACGNEISSLETPCILDGKIVCRACHDKVRPVCPYCYEELPKRPTSQSKCPRCGRKIVVRAAQRVFPSVYLTVAQGKEIDRYRHSTPASYGCTLDDFARKKHQLEAQLRRTPTADEVIASVNDEVPATEPQISYASAVGLRLPPCPTKNQLSFLLYCYEVLRYEVPLLWQTLSGRDFDGVQLPSEEIGAVVSDVLADERFVEAKRQNRQRDIDRALKSKAVRSVLADMLRRRWAQHL